MGTRQDPILVVTPVDRTAGPATPGMDRQQAVATEGTWAGFVRTEAGMVSGWHHHGEYETVIYVLSGALMMEFGPNGSNRRGRPRRLRLRSERGGAPGEQPLHGAGRHHRCASRQRGIDVQRRRATRTLTGRARWRHGRAIRQIHAVAVVAYGAERSEACLPCARAKRTISATSSASAGRATTVGRWSIIRLNARRAWS
jgi:hypothetical protein